MGYTIPLRPGPPGTIGRVGCQRKPLHELCWQQALPVLSAAVVFYGCKLPWTSLHSAVLPEHAVHVTHLKLAPNLHFSLMARIHGSKEKACYVHICMCLASCK